MKTRNPLSFRERTAFAKARLNALKSEDIDSILSLCLPGLDLSPYKLNEDEKFILIAKTIRKIMYDRDVALSGVRALNKRSDELRQLTFGFDLSADKKKSN